MYTEPKIAELKWTHVNHGLERLARFGIHSRLWNRMRFDDEFAAAVANQLAEANRVTPGKRFVGQFEKKYTRLELNDMLANRGVSVLRDRIIEQLKPWDKSNEPELIGTQYEAEWFLIDPGYSMDEEVSRMELEYRGLVPCDTEDALSFMLAHYGNIGGEHRIIILDSWTKRGNQMEFLSLSRTVAGQAGCFMTEASDLKRDSRPLFLGKRGEITDGSKNP